MDSGQVVEHIFDKVTHLYLNSWKYCQMELVSKSITPETQHSLTFGLSSSIEIAEFREGAGISFSPRIDSLSSFSLPFRN